MRVTVRIDTRVSLSDYGSSVWGGSDDEGTIASSSSKSNRSKFGSKTKSKKGSSMSSASYTSRSYGTPAVMESTSNGSRSRRPGSSSLSQPPYQNESFSRWLAGDTNSNQVSTTYNDALSSLQGLSVNNSMRGHSNWSGSQTESDDEGAHTPGALAGIPQRRLTLTKRYAVATEDGTSIHQGVQCRSCKVIPIIGLRYHCASCTQGADFVSIAR
jgi:hypothetical protein